MARELQIRARMDRRDVLKAGVVVGVSGTGCATLGSASAGGDAGLTSLLSTLDAARTAISEKPLFEAFRDPSRPDVDALVQSRAALARKTFRSLALAGAMGDLTPEQRNHPEVQRRVTDSLGEMDEAMFGMTEVLESLSASERSNVGKALREDPTLGMRILGELDQEAVTLGMSSSVRLRLRSAASQVSTRLRLSPDLAISEYTSKFRKLEARHGARAEAERKIGAALATSLVWAGDEPEGSAAGGSVEQGVPPPPVVQRSCEFNSDCGASEVCTDYKEVRDGEWSLGTCKPGALGSKPAPKRSPGFLTAGGIALGIGVPMGIAALASGGLASLVFVTIGALLALSGLIVLIIGLAYLAGGR